MLFMRVHIHALPIILLVTTDLVLRPRLHKRCQAEDRSRDINGNRRMKYTPGQGTVEFKKPTNGANGLTRDLQGRLVACEGAGRRVIRDKAVYWDPRPGMGIVILLTVHNPNNFRVTFEANHVRVYS
jgi:sugar lactone lactonase YvrE